MKSVLLVLYLYAKVGYSGGPVVTVLQVPSMDACNQIGVFIAEANKKQASGGTHWKCIAND